MSLRKVLKPFLRSRHYRGSIRIAIYADELAAWGEPSRREGRIFFSYYDPFKPGREASWWLDLWFQKSLEKSQPRQTCFHSQKPGSLEEGDYNFFLFLIFFLVWKLAPHKYLQKEDSLFHLMSQRSTMMQGFGISDPSIGPTSFS